MYSFTAVSLLKSHFRTTRVLLLFFHFNTKFIFKGHLTTVDGLEEIKLVLQQILIIDSSLNCKSIWVSQAL